VGLNLLPEPAPNRICLSEVTLNTFPAFGYLDFSFSGIEPFPVVT